MRTACRFGSPRYGSWLAGVALLLGLSVPAQELVAYKIGDRAPQDIVATVPFDVVDARATAVLRASEAAGVPAIFREHAALTNAMASQFLTAFAHARAGFTSALMSSYQQPVLDDATIQSANFGYFVTAYNMANKNFPVTAELAVLWARGDSGAAIRNKWLGLLLQTMNRPVQPDQLPDGFSVSRTIRVVPVTAANETLSLDDAARRGRVLATADAPSLAYSRAMFRREFSEEEQPLASVLSQFLRADCLPDPVLTQQARESAVRQIVVANHFDTGQVIVRRGETIDAGAKAALDQLNKELMPGVLNRQIAAEQERALEEYHQAQQESAHAQQEEDRAQTEGDAVQLARQQRQQAQLDRDRAEFQAQQESRQAAVMREQALNTQTLALKIREHDEWLFAALAAISLLTLAIVWRLVRQRQTVSISTPVRLQKMETPVAFPVELAPYLARTLKEAVVQELAAQRAEMLEAQSQAAREIAALSHRLEQLQAPLQERLRAYQERIQELQKELVERTEENRELLKLKIEMTRRQLEAEQGRVKFN